MNFLQGGQFTLVINSVDKFKFLCFASPPTQRGTIVSLESNPHICTLNFEQIKPGFWPSRSKDRIGKLDDLRKKKTHYAILYACRGDGENRQACPLVLRRFWPAILIVATSDQNDQYDWLVSR